MNQKLLSAYQTLRSPLVHPMFARGVGFPTAKWAYHLAKLAIETGVNVELFMPHRLAIGVECRCYSPSKWLLYTD